MSLYSLYLDDTRWKTEKTKHTIWAGFIVSSTEERRIIDSLNSVKIAHGLTEFDPIKFNPPDKSAYAPQKNIKHQNEFRKSVLGILEKHDVQLMAALVELPLNSTNTDAAKQLTNDLASRLQFHIQAMPAEGKRVDDRPRGCLVIAFPNKDEADVFSSQFFEICRDSAVISSNNWERLKPEVPVKLTALERAVYFSFEAHNPLLQLADFIAGSCAIALKRDNRTYFDMIKCKFRKYKGVIKGAGIIGYPSNSTMIDHLLVGPPKAKA